MKEGSHCVFVFLFHYGFPAIMFCFITEAQYWDQIIVDLDLWNCEPKSNTFNFYIIYTKCSVITMMEKNYFKS